MLRLLLQHWQSSSSQQYKPPKRRSQDVPVPDAFSQDVTKVNPIFQDDSSAASSTLSCKKARSGTPRQLNRLVGIFSAKRHPTLWPLYVPAPRREILAEVHHDPEESSLASPETISCLSLSSASTTESRKSFLHSYRGSSPGPRSSPTSNSSSPPSLEDNNNTSKSPTPRPIVGSSNLLVTGPSLNSAAEVAKQPAAPESSSSELGSSLSPVPSGSEPSRSEVVQDRSKAPDLANFIPPPPPLPNMTIKQSQQLATISERSDSGNSRPSTPNQKAASKEPLRVADLFQASINQTRNLKPSEILRKQRGIKDPEDSPASSSSATEPKRLLVMTKDEPKDTGQDSKEKPSALKTTLHKEASSEEIRVHQSTTLPRPTSGSKVSEPGSSASLGKTFASETLRRASSEGLQAKAQDGNSNNKTTSTGHRKKKPGVTRGDQVPSDEGQSSSSFHSSGSGSKKGDKPKSGSRKTSQQRQPQQGCRNCGSRGSGGGLILSANTLPGSSSPTVGGWPDPGGPVKVTANGGRQRLPPVGLAKFDDYYLAAIREARRTRSSDSLSDSLATFDNASDRRLCKSCYRHKYKSRKGYRTSADLRYPPEGSAQEASDSFFSEDYFARSNNPFNDPRTSIRGYRRSSWASCSCDQCSDLSFGFDPRRPLSSMAGTDSGEGGGGAGSLHRKHFGCTCSQAVGSRRVKFASGGSGGTKPNTDTLKSKGKDENHNDKDKDTDKKQTGSEEAKNGSAPLTEKNGFTKGLQSGFTPFPWEAEDWQSFLRKKHLKRRRRRALYMGLTALVLVVVLGMAVGLVLVWLRKANK